MLRGEGCPAWCPWTCRQIPPAPSRMCSWDTELNVSSTKQKLLAEDGARPQSMLRIDPQLSANLCGCMGAQTRTQVSHIDTYMRLDSETGGGQIFSKAVLSPVLSMLQLLT